MTDAALPPLIAALMDPRRYPHPVAAVELVETHISWVLLAGAFAYKIKKPVAPGFLDFTTLDARRHFCGEELRLNRATAPQIYLEVVAIGGSTDAPLLEGGGLPIEYALRMRRFAQDALLDGIARRGELSPALIDRLALVIASFHARAAAGADGVHGSAEQVRGPARDNFTQIAQLAAPAADTTRLAALQAWTAGEGRRLETVFTARKAAGRVRECHGDLHLGNIALIDGVPVPFDCIEFNPEFRWIDVISEIAFLMMDLFDRGYDALAWRFLDGYLQECGDYAGIAVLRYYLVYRAMVRAKVALIHARQIAPGPAQGDEVAAFSHHVRLAEKLSAGVGGALVLMHGLSGSGKSQSSQALAAALGAVRVRSDVERKRLAGLAAGGRSGEMPGAGLYSAASSASTYGRLAAIAATVLAGDWRVIVDAASLRTSQREALRRVARAAAVPFVLVSRQAPVNALRGRLARRAAAGTDASDADAGVLDHQLATQDALGAAELAAAVVVTDDDADAAVAARVDAAIGAATRDSVRS